MMGNLLPINALLQMSSIWDDISEDEQLQLVREGMFVEETLEKSPIWESCSQERRQQIFIEAWSSYAKISNLKWAYFN